MAKGRLVTVDASAAVPWIVRDQATARSDGLFQDGLRKLVLLQAPALWLWECGNVFAGLVSGALAQLDAEGKLLLLLYYEQQLTLDQMAGVLGTSKPTLSRRLERLRRGLRDAIEITARQDLRVSADTLRERLDFSRLEFDLATALGGGPVKQGGGGDV